MNKTQISIVLAVYNGAKYLKESIDSILCQSFGDFELIIINDGSTDSSESIIQQYTDSRIVYVNNETNKGLVTSLNIGLAKSCGKYVARMDADDIAFPNRLEVQYNYMEAHPEVGLCGSSVEAFWVDSKRSQRVDFATTDIAIRAFTFFQSPFCHPTVIIRKEVLDKYNLNYSKDYYLAEDYALWIELLRYTKAANIPQVLLRYRKHKGSETALGDAKGNVHLDVVMRIHEQYLLQHGINTNIFRMESYSRFTDRSLRCDLLMDQQKRTAEMLQHLLSELSVRHKELISVTRHYLSTVCFYKFFTAKRIPSSFLLQKLCLQGLFIYLKRIF